MHDPVAALENSDHQYVCSASNSICIVLMSLDRTNMLVGVGVGRHACDSHAFICVALLGRARTMSEDKPEATCSLLMYFTSYLSHGHTQ